MSKNQKLASILSKIIYALLGFILIVGGGIALFHSTVLLPNVNIIDINEVDIPYFLKMTDHFVHFTKEMGAAVLTLGLVFGYALFNLEKMEKLNYILLFFWLVMGGIHWLEFFQGNRTFVSPLINSIPFLLMGMVIFLRKKLLFK